MIYNPILRGFCPDPSIICVGNDYYTATSTFEWWPGVKLFHSTDLVNWERLPAPLRRESQLELLGDPCSGGVWAPCLTYDGDKYYLVFTDVKTKKGRFYNTHNYIITANDIRDDWSEPIYLNSIGFDPSLFHDNDGRKYLVNMVNGFKGVLVQEIDPQTFSFVGEQRKVYTGSGLGFTEGPHIYHINGWYYLVVAEGGTSYDHCVTVARAPSVWGPFETMPNNPLLTSDRDDPSALQKCGHGDLVRTPDGEWYIAHLCSRPLKSGVGCPLGRETALQKLFWNNEGWPELACGGKFAHVETESPAFSLSTCLYKPDFCTNFDEKVLDEQFLSPRVPLSFSLSARPGFLRLYGRESLNSLHRVSLAAINQREFYAKAKTVIEFSPSQPEQMAGLVYGYDALNFYLLALTADDSGQLLVTFLKSDGGVISEPCEPQRVGKKTLTFYAETSTDGASVEFFFDEGDGARQIGGAQSVGMLTDEHCKGFTGAFFGLYVHDMTGKGIHADFDSFEIRYPEAK